MQKIVCIDNNMVKEYQMTCDLVEMDSFLSSLEERIILPVPITNDVVSLYNDAFRKNPFDSFNTLLTYDDIKEYIKQLCQSTVLDLSQLYVLLNSNGSMRSIEVYDLFCEFLNLYTYQEVFRYDAYYTSALLRKECEHDSKESAVDPQVMKINSRVLGDIGFSIESKLQSQKRQKKYQ